MVKVLKQLVSQHIISTRSHGKGNSCEYIAIHETANTQINANAQAHSNLQTNGNRREASWHYQVDDNHAIQSFDDNIKCWHVGNSNPKAIAIEICINADGNFNKAVDNAVALTKKLMKKHNIPISKVKQHNFFTGKNCPTLLRNKSKGISWDDFINKVKGKSSSNPAASKPSKPSTRTYTGNSVVDYLKHNKQDSSFANRAKLAKKYGISNYKGTPSQNTRLLNVMRNGKPATSKPTKSKQRGVATVTVATLNLRDKPSTSGKVIRKLSKGESYKVWEEKNGWLRLGNDMWASWQSGAYMDWTEKPTKKKKPKPKTFKVGQTVTLKKSASKFATGQPIASHAKGKKYKIIQVKSDRVLLDKIMSWVKKSDVQ